MAKVSLHYFLFVHSLLENAACERIDKDLLTHTLGSRQVPNKEEQESFLLEHASLDVKLLK